MKQFLSLLIIIYYITGFAYANKIESNKDLNDHSSSCNTWFASGILPNGSKNHDKTVKALCKKVLSIPLKKLYMQVFYSDSNPNFIDVKDNGLGLSATLQLLPLMYNKLSYASSYSQTNTKFFSGYAPTRIIVKLAHSKKRNPKIDILFSSKTSNCKCVLSNDKNYE